MGYFSNGSEGESYEGQFCDRCVHQKVDDGGCAVWLLHLMANYEECNKADSYLHVLIPRSEGGRNLECAMFHEEAESRDATRIGSERHYRLKGAFDGCQWCKGRGCSQCDLEREKYVSKAADGVSFSES